MSIYYLILFIFGTLRELYVTKKMFEFQIDIPIIVYFVDVFQPLVFYWFY